MKIGENKLGKYLIERKEYKKALKQKFQGFGDRRKEISKK